MSWVTLRSSTLIVLLILVVTSTLASVSVNSAWLTFADSTSCKKATNDILLNTDCSFKDQCGGANTLQLSPCDTPFNGLLFYPATYQFMVGTWNFDYQAAAIKIGYYQPCCGSRYSTPRLTWTFGSVGDLIAFNSQLKGSCVTQLIKKNNTVVMTPPPGNIDDNNACLAGAFNQSIPIVTFTQTYDSRQ